MAATDNAAEQVAHIAEKIRAGKTTLGIEFGSTRIKAVLIDDNFQTIASGDYSWASHLEDGLWSYTTEEIWGGLQSAYASMANDVETAYGEKLTHVGHIGFSAMMHGYLAFDEAGELLVPFRTWQNTNTSEAHKKLSELFQYNIPERWSIAHLYQAVLEQPAFVATDGDFGVYTRWIEEEFLPSVDVRTHQPSPLLILMSGAPALTMGSMVKTMPGFSTTLVSGES